LIDLEGKAGRKLYDVPLRGLSEDGGLWLDLVALDPSMGVVGWLDRIRAVQFEPLSGDFDFVFGGFACAVLDASG
jgi:hypothetical protein